MEGYYEEWGYKTKKITIKNVDEKIIYGKQCKELELYGYNKHK